MSPPDRIVALRLSDQEADSLHHAIATTISLMDQAGPIPKAAPLYGARPRLVRIARRLDHERNHRGALPNPHEGECDCCKEAQS